MGERGGEMEGGEKADLQSKEDTKRAGDSLNAEEIISVGGDINLVGVGGTLLLNHLVQLNSEIEAKLLEIIL